MQDELIDGAARVVGLYHDGEQVGFTRTLSDGHTQSYLADVYVLEEHRGRGLGVELVRFSVDEGPFARRSGSCTRADAHELYRKFGFGEPGDARSSAWSSASRGSVPASASVQSSASLSWTNARAPAIGIRSCASESRSRIVTVSSSSVCSSIVSAYGVPISSWRR